MVLFRAGEGILNFIQLQWNRLWAHWSQGPARSISLLEAGICFYDLNWTAGWTLSLTSASNDKNSLKFHVLVAAELDF